MSWWNPIDVAKKAADFAVDTATAPFQLVGKALGMPNADDRRKQMAGINEQVKFYRNQTNIANSEIARARDQQLVEKRRIEEKQIRSLRRNFRPAGFMDSGSDEGMSNKLGA